VARMRRALAETTIEGIRTTIPFHQKLLADPAVLEGGARLTRLEL
jgi:acetyl-CoA carboxylase biotin carboxylase subunit